jgi:hypothetical protein
MRAISPQRARVGIILNRLNRLNRPLARRSRRGAVASGVDWLAAGRSGRRGGAMTDDPEDGAPRRDAELTRTLDDSTSDGGRIARPTDPPPALAGGDRPEQRYTVEAEHARGGIGVILRARDARLDRAIAIKELATTANPRSITRRGRDRSGLDDHHRAPGRALQLRGIQVPDRLGRGPAS